MLIEAVRFTVDIVTQGLTGPHNIPLCHPELDPRFKLEAGLNSRFRGNDKGEDKNNKIKQD